MEQRLAQILQKLGTYMLLRRQEESKLTKMRHLELIRHGNTAAHEGTTLTAAFHLHLTPDPIGSEWYKAIYGLNCCFIEEFGRHRMILNPADWARDIIATAMSSPTRSANGDSKTDDPSAPRPTTPVTPTKVTTKSPNSRKFPPTSPIVYFSEQVVVKRPECNSLIITIGHRESTYFEDHCSPDPERDEQKYTEKLELIKKQVKIHKMVRDVQSLTKQIGEMEKVCEPVNVRLEALQKRLTELIASHQSKRMAIGQIQSSSLNSTQGMSAADTLEARKARAKVAKLELEAMESEIEVLEFQVLVDAEHAAAETSSSKLKAAEIAISEMSSAIVELKSDYEKCNSAWVSKYSIEESTYGSGDADGGQVRDTLGKLEQASRENTALQMKVAELSNDIETVKAAAAEEIRLLKAVDSVALKASEAKVLAQAKELESLKAFTTCAQKDIDTKSDEKIKALEGKIEIMKPIYRLGRFVRYRNNYSILRKKYEGQNINVNWDKYEEGHAAYFAGHVVADSTMYHAGFDEDDTRGRDKNNFEDLHHGVPAKMVWELRNDFKILAKILDMASNMKVYTATEDKNDEEFGTVEFKEHFEKVFSRINPSYRTYAITSDEEFLKNADLVAALNAMCSIAYFHSSKNWRDRRRGVEESWEQPWENAWMDFADDLYETNRRGMC
ncbi:hypothetical protein BKA61DRAFT_667564 [Leptodontidium sp. MPI-SDFR-AT-0119]|nr:hypothetical protein BKA61DRAFT_667564 [Leptodontidium sp. MPI-SDFR-AT-0119]